MVAGDVLVMMVLVSSGGEWQRWLCMAFVVVGVGGGDE